MRCDTVESCRVARVRAQQGLDACTRVVIAKSCEREKDELRAVRQRLEELEVVEAQQRGIDQQARQRAARERERSEQAEKAARQSAERERLKTEQRELDEFLEAQTSKRRNAPAGEAK